MNDNVFYTTIIPPNSSSSSERSIPVGPRGLRPGAPPADSDGLVRAETKDENMSLRRLALLALVIYSAGCCDLEQFFSERQVSVEESASSSQIVFRGVTVAEASPDVPGVFTAYFELINTYKGADALGAWSANNYRYVRIKFHDP